MPSLQALTSIASKAKGFFFHFKPRYRLSVDVIVVAFLVAIQWFFLQTIGTSSLFSSRKLLVMTGLPLTSILNPHTICPPNSIFCTFTSILCDRKRFEFLGDIETILSKSCCFIFCCGAAHLFGHVWASCTASAFHKSDFVRFSLPRPAKRQELAGINSNQQRRSGFYSWRGIWTKLCRSSFK